MEMSFVSLKAIQCKYSVMIFRNILPGYFVFNLYYRPNINFYIFQNKNILVEINITSL